MADPVKAHSDIVLVDALTEQGVVDKEFSRTYWPWIHQSGVFQDRCGC
jgi:hypothetical protein